MLQLTGLVDRGSNQIVWDAPTSTDKAWASIVIRLDPDTHQHRALSQVERLLQSEPWFNSHRGRWVIDMGSLSSKFSDQHGKLPEHMKLGSVFVSPEFDDGKWMFAFLDADPMASIKINIDQHNIFLAPRSANSFVRSVLDEILATFSDLERFLIDYYPDIQRRVQGATDRVAVVNLLLQCHDPKDILAALLADIDQQKTTHNDPHRQVVEASMRWAVVRDAEGSQSS